MKKRTYHRAILESLGEIDTDRAWDLRKSFEEECLPWVLLSLRGLQSDRSWEWRKKHIDRAPKIIMKTLGGSEDPRAWELREKAKDFAKEVLDSISGIDSSHAWKLRTSLSEKWPNTSVSSLGAGNQSERAWNYRWEQLKKYPDNILLLKHIAKASLRGKELAEGEDNLQDDIEEVDFT